MGLGETGFVGQGAACGKQGDCAVLEPVRHGCVSERPLGGGSPWCLPDLMLFLGASKPVKQSRGLLATHATLLIHANLISKRAISLIREQLLLLFHYKMIFLNNYLMPELIHSALVSIALPGPLATGYCGQLSVKIITNQALHTRA